MKRKRLFMIICIVLAAIMLSGCGLIGGIDPREQMDTIINGTMTGNIVNWGFAAADDIYLYLFYADGPDFDLGSIVRSDLTTGEHSLVIKDGGLYMSIVDQNLYYCRKDGIFFAPLDTFEPERLYEGEVTLLQFADDHMYFIQDGAICSLTVEGEPWNFAQIDDAECVNVTDEGLFYINQHDEKIWRAQLDGTQPSLYIDQKVDLFCVFKDDIYFIDSASGYIMSAALKEEAGDAKTVIEYRCSGFNLNQYGVFYTRNADGQNRCFRADLNGVNEEEISEGGSSVRHLVCIFNEGGLVVAQEEFAHWLE